MGVVGLWAGGGSEMEVLGVAGLGCVVGEAGRGGPAWAGGGRVGRSGWMAEASRGRLWRLWECA